MSCNLAQLGATYCNLMAHREISAKEIGMMVLNGHRSILRIDKLLIMTQTRFIQINFSYSDFEEILTQELMIVNAELFSQYEKSQNEDNEMMRTDEE
jgi:hypothetical protein